MVNVGIVGIGFMGMIHYLAYETLPGVRVRAICTRDKKRLAGDWRGIQGNFGPAGKQMDLAGVERYSEYDALVADKRIDLIDICLPPAMHAAAVTRALAAGKHVLCEKPMALSTREARTMLAAAAKAKRQLAIGHNLPFVPEFRFALQAILGGRFGRLLGATLKRVIADPLWLPDYFDAKRVGGPLVDLLIHDAHFIRAACGMPKMVITQGIRRGQMPEFVTSQFIYGDKGPMVTITGGVVRQQGRAFVHGFEIYLEGGTLTFEFSVVDGQAQSQPLTVLDHKGRVTRPALGSGDMLEAFVAELGDVTRSIRTGKPSTILSGELASDALTLCFAQQKSLMSGKPVKLN